MTAKYDENHSRLPARFRAKITLAPPPAGIEGDCWLWTGALNSGAHNGYGAVKVEGRVLGAHRVVYELLVGPIPAGLTLDHSCRRHRCVAPAHLEPVTNAENCRRGARGRLVTACPQGDVYDAENTGWRNIGQQRYCKRCARARAARNYARQRAA